ncbi:Uncharacterized protein dnl_31630 [Desulfonema limicola]|uniref:Uncharacterized protein n=1 Tax=Desulfonema limicola TaxID=45656 RepID=A0A975GGZ1_9BACT|nr:hypothetical protein [Desulfonema limicola]QTA80850.1 Uncharacterized protein dnl_31630 [Desulfonema limicola]
MRGCQFWKHRTGAGARNDDMDNTCELLINGVSDRKPKMLTGFDQKVRVMEGMLRFRSPQTNAPDLPGPRKIIPCQT